jgi:hypothetical protein
MILLRLGKSNPNRLILKSAYFCVIVTEAFHMGNYKKYSTVWGQHLLQTPTPSIFSAWGAYLVELSLYDKFDG